MIKIDFQSVYSHTQKGNKKRGEARARGKKNKQITASTNSINRKKHTKANQHDYQIKGNLPSSKKEKEINFKEEKKYMG